MSSENLYEVMSGQMKLNEVSSDESESDQEYDGIWSMETPVTQRDNNNNNYNNHEGDEDEDLSMQAPTSASKMTSMLNYEIFSSLIPEKKYLTSVFGGDRAAYDEFTKNAFLWDEFFELCKYKLFTLADFIHNEHFYKMIDVNDRLSELKNDTEGVLPLLRDLMGRKRHFIIPFVYIANYVPKQYENTNLVAFGAGHKYPQLVAKAKTEIESSKKAMRPVKDILRAYHVFYESAF